MDRLENITIGSSKKLRAYLISGTASYHSVLDLCLCLYVPTKSVKNKAFEIIIFSVCFNKFKTVFHIKRTQNTEHRTQIKDVCVLLIKIFLSNVQKATATWRNRIMKSKGSVLGKKKVLEKI